VADPESLETLTAQLAELRASLAEARGRLAQFAARLDRETGPLMLLQLDVKKLKEKVEAAIGKLSAAKTGDADEPTAPRWDKLGDKAEIAQLAELRQWVDDVLRVQYPGYLRHLPPCWYAHREALWELGTLQAEWNRVFGGDDPPLGEAQWWHERWLPGILTRLRTAITCDQAGCSLQPRPQRSPVDFGQTITDPRAAMSFPGQPGPRR